MRSRAILTAAATTAATLGGVLAPAGTAAATTAPLTKQSPPTAPHTAPTPGVLAVENDLQLADGWCVAPLYFSGSLLADPFPGSSDACGHGSTGEGFRVLSNMCIAPITTDDGAAPSTPCREADETGPGFEILRNISVAGVQTTF